MSDPKARAEQGLRELVDAALKVVRESLTTPGKAPRGQQTRSADAWRVLDVVLQVAADKAEQQPKGARIDPEAAVLELRKRIGKP